MLLSQVIAFLVLSSSRRNIIKCVGNCFGANLGAMSSDKFGATLHAIDGQAKTDFGRCSNIGGCTNHPCVQQVERLGVALTLV